MLVHWDASEFGKGGLHVRELEGIRPVVLVGCSQHSEYFEDLVDLRIAHEQGSLLEHLSKNTACGPKINAQRIMLGAQKDFWTPVPESNHFMCVSLNWKPKCASQAKVCQLNNLPIRRNQQVLGFQVSVKNSVGVEEEQSLEDLPQEALALSLREWFADALHVLLKVEFEVLEYQIELILGEQDLLQPKINWLSRKRGHTRRHWDV